MAFNAGTASRPGDIVRRHRYLEGRSAVNRNFLIAGGVAVAIAVGMPASGQTVSRHAVGQMPSYPRAMHSFPSYIGLGAPSHSAAPSEVKAWEVAQLVRWGDVGKCVAAKDRDASYLYATAKSGSPEAKAAAERLDPAFASCLSGAGIEKTRNKAFRRAAVADALGIRFST
jgi:hypothetical protein